MAAKKDDQLRADGPEAECSGTLDRELSVHAAHQDGCSDDRERVMESGEVEDFSDASLGRKALDESESLLD